MVTYEAGSSESIFYKAGSIDLLIGGGTFYDLLENERVRVCNGLLGLQDTKFGWLVTGEIGARCLVSMSSIGNELEEDWAVLHLNEDKSSFVDKTEPCLKTTELVLNPIHHKVYLPELLKLMTW